MNDLDAAVHMCADGEVAAHGQRFIELGLDPDHVVLNVRIFLRGLSHAAEVMRYNALAAIMYSEITKLEIATRLRELFSWVVPMLGPMVQDIHVHAVVEHDED
ncbi:hypothetical protein A8144_07570 [Mycobacterium leprae 3125609]|nr:adenylate cyclase regulatory domain-containing protein [Mycobacterium leprae]OAR21211.1 hypothetical protein A8144_07570 [Mycobacterium leprae 3125609]